MSIWLMLLLWVVVLSAAYAGFSAAPWVPTKPRECRALLAELALKGHETVYDLGCGSGSLLFALTKIHPNAITIGYDISVLPLFLGWMHKLCFWRRYRNVHLRFGNLYTKDVSKADVIFMFLMERAYPKLLTTLRRTVRDDTVIALEAWPFVNIEPERVIRAKDCLPVYIYTGKQLRS